MPQCDSHLEMVKSVAIIETTIVGLDKKINGSLAAIEKHMDQGNQWRVAIIGVAATLLIQLGAGIIVFSRLSKQVEINTGRICNIEGVLPEYYANKGIHEESIKRLDYLEKMFGKLIDRINTIERVSYGYRKYIDNVTEEDEAPDEKWSPLPQMQK